MSDSLLAALRPARARLDLDRLAANYLAVAAAAGRPVMPVVKAGAYGHGAGSVRRHLVALAAADEDADATRRQLDLFDEAADELARRGIRPRWIHAANSAGLAFLRRHHTLVRPGLILYGVRPRPLAPAIDVKPVMTVSADIELVEEVAVGTPVSYGGRWIAPRRSRIATIPFGYADGVPRTDDMRDRGELLVKGRRVPVAGTVCMDLTMADLTDHPDAGEGDEAVLFGDDPPACDVADRAGPNAWEIL